MKDLSPAAPPARRPYVKPALETEKIFEVNAPTCGKCQRGPTGGLACSRLRRNS